MSNTKLDEKTRMVNKKISKGDVLGEWLALPLILAVAAIIGLRDLLKHYWTSSPEGRHIVEILLTLAIIAGFCYCFNAFLRKWGLLKEIEREHAGSGAAITNTAETAGSHVATSTDAKNTITSTATPVDGLDDDDEDIEKLLEGTRVSTNTSTPTKRFGR